MNFLVLDLEAGLGEWEEKRPFSIVPGYWISLVLETHP